MYIPQPVATPSYLSMVWKGFAARENLRMYTTLLAGAFACSMVVKGWFAESKEINRSYNFSDDI